jgi:hypothetical protein
VQFGYGAFGECGCIIDTLLREYGAHAVIRSVDLEEKFAFKIGLLEDRCSAHAPLEFLKGSELRGAEVPGGGSFCEVKEWACDSGVVGHKVTVVPCEAKEFAYFSNIAGLLPVRDTLQFLGVHAELAIANHDTQEFNFALFKLTLCGFEEEVILFQHDEDAVDVFLVALAMVGLCFIIKWASVYGHVVHVDGKPALVDLVAKMVFIMAWNVAGEFVRPKNMTVGSNSPSRVRKAAFHSSPSLMRTLLYPQRTSKVVKRVHPARRSITWGMSGETLRLRIVYLLTGL